jgi:two-component system response regulator DesR
MPSNAAAMMDRPFSECPDIHFEIGMSEPVIRPRVVIAEDFVLIQEQIRQLLLPDCDVVAVVEDGGAALEAIALYNPDILVADISLPVMSGFAVAEKLKIAQSKVAVIFVTAHSERDYVKRAFEIGVKGYVLKRAMRTELPAAIRQIVAGSRYRSPLAS